MATWPKYDKKHKKVPSQDEPGTFWHVVKLTTQHHTGGCFVESSTMKDESTAEAVARRKIHHKIKAHENALAKTREQGRRKKESG